jgi:hypothetical protein
MLAARIGRSSAAGGARAMPTIAPAAWLKIWRLTRFSPATSIDGMTVMLRLPTYGFISPAASVNTQLRQCNGSARMR